MARITPGIFVVLLLMASASAQPNPFGPPGGGFRPHRPFGGGPPPGMEMQPQRPVPGTTIDPAVPIDKQVEQSIDRGVKYLLSKQRADGCWNDGDDTRNDVGKTALAGMALLSCGVSHQSPEMVKAIDYLKAAKIEERDLTYCLALRTAFFSQLPESVRKPTMNEDLRLLTQIMISKGRFSGLYDYGRDGRWPDFSNSQYGVLGVWYASLAGMEISNDYWAKVEEGWLRGRCPDGGWPYNLGDAHSRATMTAAAAATLYVTYDALHAREELALTTQPRRAMIPLDGAIKWLGNNFSLEYNVGDDNTRDMSRGDDPFTSVVPPDRMQIIASWVHYMLFGYERVGEATGLTRFGIHKWFDEGAHFLIYTQAADGGWDDDPNPMSYVGNVVGTSYSLLFLSRGRSPVAMQKLQTKGRWNNRSRDCAMVARWLTHETERHTNWQIVPAETSAAEFREAPILYVASDQKLDLSDSDKQRIKKYIDEGGLLFAVNEGSVPSSAASKPTSFVQSIYDLARELYPAYEFRNLPPDHVIYGENFPVKGLPTVPRALSNGVRELIIVMPTGDISWKFQQGAGTTNPALAPAFGFFGNVYSYMNDKANPRFKGDDTWLEADPNTQDKTELQVARIKINANWNPEPLGWTRLRNVLHNTDAIKLMPLEIDPNVGALPNTIPLAHMTATNQFELSKQNRDWLKTYLDGGGVLLFDAAGGSTAAQVSFEALLATIYPGESLKPLPIEHAIYTGDGFNGAKITQATYRRFAMEKIAKSNLPRLRILEVKGRIVAIDSPEDLSAGLVGYNIDGIVGYSPASATEIVRNIVLWAASGSPSAPGKAPG